MGNPPFSPLSAGVVDAKRANPAPALAAAASLARFCASTSARDVVVFPFGPMPMPNARPAARPVRMSVAIPGNARAPPTPPTIAAPRPSALLPICDAAMRRFSSSVYAREGPSIARRDAAWSRDAVGGALGRPPAPFVPITV